MTDVVQANGGARPLNGKDGYDSKPLLELYVKVGSKYFKILIALFRLPELIAIALEPTCFARNIGWRCLLCTSVELSESKSRQLT